MQIATLVYVSVARVRFHTGPLENRYLNLGRPGYNPLFPASIWKAFPAQSHHF